MTGQQWLSSLDVVRRVGGPGGGSGNGEAHGAAVAGDRNACARRHRSIACARKRIARQEQAIAYLAACGHSTARAEIRLEARRGALDALLQRHTGAAAGLEAGI